ncbi:type II secretion system protein E [Candidatus Nitrosoglobus terrae]|uniref:Type II secretion system protein E n=1 Tax=Candidatus Nitrosoglobus terrae TaxID=1630141 RepID=A0A1Q2SPN0_9GAMM|nr:type IV-A pilus assembly ATPase PilB [Candidatus Nitrosoglobus terrae]BAW81094.1 type II secretion system protein E [Candidatus Nitrosoglobus terrae]
MLTPQTQTITPGLVRLLVKEGLLTQEAAPQHYEQSRKAGTSFVSYLIQQKLVESRNISQVISREFGIPLFDLDTLDLNYLPKGLIEEKLLIQHRALPIFKRGNRLFVALADPTNLQALSEIKFHTGINTEAIIVEEDKLTRTIEQITKKQDTSLAELHDIVLDSLETPSSEDESSGITIDPSVDDTPIVRFINQALLDAINRGASDIHFEPYEKSYRIRYRQDGILHEVSSPPIALATRIAARIKVMARLDISERRIPQDGRMKMKISKQKAIDFRVSTCPTLFGEKIVLRILDPTSAQLGIEALGYEENQKNIFLETIHRPYGMVLVTGPTGSGKTVSLYTALNILNTGDRNISTAEDPAEINLPGINQVNIYPKVGLTFAGTLRAFLRQDPDVIMVGEIRDLETAEIAIKAAQTGHMVLSTLHTNDAPQTLTRLSNMGVASYNIASAVSLIIAQRLIRRLCVHCKTPHEVPDETLLEEGFTEAQINASPMVYKASSDCQHCSGGYKGRIGIYQVMPVSEKMGQMIMAGGNAIELAQQAKKEGITDLRQSGIKKVIEGITSLDEINRVTKE